MGEDSMWNLLYRYRVDYDNFLDIATNHRDVQLLLDRSSTVGLFRRGIIKNRNILFLMLLMYLSFLFGLILLVWLPLYTLIIAFIISFIFYKKIRIEMSKSTWKELLGKGKMSHDQSAHLYALLLKHDMIYCIDEKIKLHLPHERFELD